MIADTLHLDRSTRRLLSWATLSAIVAVASAVGLLALSGWFLSAAAMAGAAGPAAALGFNYLIPSATIRLLAILRTVSRYGERLFAHRAALEGMAGLRANLFGRLAAQDSRTAPNLSGGDASARLIGDIDALEELIIRRPTRPAALVAALVGVGLASLAGWGAGLVLLGALVLLPRLVGRVARRLTREPAHEAAEALGTLRIRYVDYAAARAEIAAYGLADRVTTALDDATARLDQARARLHRAEGLIAALIAAYTAGTVAAVLFAADAPAPRVALALLAAAGSIEAMTGLARSAFRAASVDAGLRRIAALAALREDRQVTDDAISTGVLDLGALRLEAGELVAVTGRSGSGKTLLLEALAGMRAVEMASPLPDAAPGLCALSPQDAAMVAGSIADNLRLARAGVDETAMWEALHVTCLDERIRAMPAGLETRLGEGVGQLSGGERKRLSLARALLAGRPWLLLDEPTEGLDAVTEAQLVEHLRDWLDRTGAGLLLVSHRPAPLALAERMIPVERLGPRPARG